MKKINCPICSTTHKDEIDNQLCPTCGWEFEFHIGANNKLGKIKKNQKLVFRNFYGLKETAAQKQETLKKERIQLEENLNKLKTQLDQLIFIDKELEGKPSAENSSSHDYLSVNEIQKILRNLKMSTGLNSRQLELELSDFDLAPKNEIICELKGTEIQFKMDKLPEQDINLILGLSQGQPVIRIQDADLFINIRISKNSFYEEKRDEWVANKKLDMNLRGKFHPRFSKFSYDGNDFRRISTKGDKITL